MSVHSSSQQPKCETKDLAVICARTRCVLLAEKVVADDGGNFGLLNCSTTLQLDGVWSLTDSGGRGGPTPQSRSQSAARVVESEAPAEARHRSQKRPREVRDSDSEDELRFRFRRRR